MAGIAASIDDWYLVVTAAPPTREPISSSILNKEPPTFTSSTQPNMANFVRAQIFGTTFEITSRYTDLQPVGMGAFGLVWYNTIHACSEILATK